ncbi:putative zinc finger protein GLIS3 isoform X1 [Microtus ochrogaster]|uniref:Putative zinc finger protein GLIS3 isoform X1 n=1 Tax=Microtus ochrogaster TaxID=79684 RepID=A0A8J6LAQ4_MICOH|nr:putative zinc finger protein GLIS3 isoform X1 [Microtus ochrogaster]
MNGRSCGMSLHRPSRNPQGPGLLSGQYTPPIRAHSGTPGPSSCASLPSPAIGSPANSLHLRMSSGAGMAAQSNMALSPIHLPALSPRRQLLTNGKPQFPVTQARGLAASLTVKPKQQEFGDLFSPNPEKVEGWILSALEDRAEPEPVLVLEVLEEKLCLEGKA